LEGSPGAELGLAKRNRFYFGFVDTVAKFLEGAVSSPLPVESWKAEGEYSFSDGTSSVV
jgi:hypothetical protein